MAIAQGQVGIKTKEGVAVAMKDAAARTREAAAAAQQLLEAQTKLADLATRQSLTNRHIERTNLIPGGQEAVDLNRPYLTPGAPPQLEYPELVPPAQQVPLYSGTKEAAELNALLTGLGERVKYLQQIYSDTRTAAERYAFEIQKLNIAFGDNRGEEYQRALAHINRQYNENFIAIRELGSEMGQAFQQGIVMGRDWSDMLKTVLFDVIGLIAKMTILKSLAGKSGGVAGFFSSLLGGIFGGGRASGGPVYAGAGYVVGEQGPEWFAPASNGFILPNSALQPAGAGQVVQIDARGADAGVEYRVRRAFVELARSVPAIAIAAVKDYSSRR